MKTDLQRFYLDEANSSRYTISKVLAWSDDKWEEVHDFIQWVFPLMEPSRYNEFVPILTMEDISFFRNNLAPYQTFQYAAVRFGKFLKLYSSEEAHWDSPWNHNLLRITGAIKSIHLIVGKTAANEFLDAVMRKANGFNGATRSAMGQSIEFWKVAAGIS